MAVYYYLQGTSGRTTVSDSMLTQISSKPSTSMNQRHYKHQLLSKVRCWSAKEAVEKCLQLALLFCPWYLQHLDCQYYQMRWHFVTHSIWNEAMKCMSSLILYLYLNSALYLCNTVSVRLLSVGVKIAGNLSKSFCSSYSVCSSLSLSLLLLSVKTASLLKINEHSSCCLLCVH